MTGPAAERAAGPVVVVHSFGHLHGIPRLPQPSSLYLDLACLRDPHRDPAMRYLTGLDPAVRDHVLSTRDAADLIADLIDQAWALIACRPARRLSILVGCQGGRHRSVVVAEELAARLRACGVAVEVVHHHIDRPVVDGRVAAGAARLDPYAGLIECDRDGCPEDFDEELDETGWAHGVEHVHVIDHYMVREEDVERLED